MKSLTVRQRQIFDYIVETLKVKGYSPSLAEIGETFQLTSLATSHKHVTNLIEKGYIKRAWNRSRSIEIVMQADGHCPTCGRPIESAAI